jgi:hypothetical protein
MPANPPAVFSAEDKERYQKLVDAWSGFHQTKDATKRKELIDNLEMPFWVPKNSEYRNKYYIGNMRDATEEPNDLQWDRGFVLLAITLFLRDDRTDVKDDIVEAKWRDTILQDVGASEETKQQWPEYEYSLFLQGGQTALTDWWDAHKV